MRRRIATLALGLVCILGVAACGSSNDAPAAKAFGGLSTADQEQLKAWFEDAKALPAIQIKIARALTSGDIDAFGAQADRFDGVVRDLDAAIVRFDSAELQEALSDYMAPLDDVSGAYGRLVVYASDDTTAADPATEDSILRDLQSAGARSQREDRRLIARLAKVLSPEQREKLLAGYEKALEKQQAQLEQATGG